MDLTEMFEFMVAPNAEAKESAKKPEVVDNVHATKRQKAADGGSQPNKRQKTGQVADGGGKLKPKKGISTKPIEVPQRNVGAASGSKGGDKVSETKKRQASWLAPGFQLPTDEDGGLALAKEIANVTKLTNVGKPGSYPPYAGTGKLARVVDVGLLEELKQKKVKAAELISHLGDSLSEVSTFANALASRFEEDVDEARTRVKELEVVVIARETKLTELIANEKKLKDDLALAKKEAEEVKVKFERLEAEHESLKEKIKTVEEEKNSLKAEVVELGKRPMAVEVDPEAELEERKRVMTENFKCYQRGELFTLRALRQRCDLQLSPQELAELLHRTSNVAVRDDHVVIPFDEEELERLKGKLPDWEVPKPVKGNIVEILNSLRAARKPVEEPKETENLKEPEEEVEYEEEEEREVLTVDDAEVVKESEQKDQEA